MTFILLSWLEAEHFVLLFFNPFHNDAQGCQLAVRSDDDLVFNQFAALGFLAIPLVRLLLSPLNLGLIEVSYSNIVEEVRLPPVRVVGLNILCVRVD